MIDVPQSEECTTFADQPYIAGEHSTTKRGNSPITLMLHTKFGQKPFSCFGEEVENMEKFTYDMKKDENTVNREMFVFVSFSLFSPFHRRVN